MTKTFAFTDKILIIILSHELLNRKSLALSKTVLVFIPGIGLETARDLSRRGARVILGCRNMNKGISAAQDIVKSSGNKNIEVKKLDLSSMATVRQFAKEFMETEQRYVLA